MADGRRFHRLLEPKPDFLDNPIMRYLRENNDERNVTWFGLLTVKEELDILDEILAYGTQWNGATKEELASYFQNPAQHAAETMSGLLPDCGTVSRHRSQKLVEEKFTDSVSKKIMDKDAVMVGSRFYSAEFAQWIGDGHLSLPEPGLLPNNGIVSRHKAKAFLENATREYFEEQFDKGNGAFKILYKNLPFETVSRIVRSCESADELVGWSRHYKEVPGVGNE